MYVIVYQDLVARAAAHAVKEAVAEAKLDVFSARRTMSGKTAAETWMEEMDAGLPNATLKPEEEILIKRESDLDSDDDDIQGAVGKERKPQKIRKREKLESAKVFLTILAYISTFLLLFDRLNNSFYSKVSYDLFMIDSRHSNGRS